jgi:copper chaperone CopZ
VRTTLRSIDLTYPSSVGVIEHLLRDVPGVTRATVHFATGHVVVDHDDVPAQVLVGAIAEAGHTARVTSAAKVPA